MLSELDNSSYPTLIGVANKGRHLLLEWAANKGLHPILI